MTDLIGGAPAIRRARNTLGIVLVLAASVLAVTAMPASAAYVHTNVTGEYGKEGPKATGMGSGCRLAYQSANQRLYVLTESKIYALQRSGPGSVAPIGGNFPLSIANSNCGDPDFEVDNSSGSSKNNVYYVASSTTISGYNSSGTALSSPWPINLGSGEICGLAVDGSGNVYAGYYTPKTVQKYSSAGAPLATIPIGFSLCKIEVDRSTGDLYVKPYSSSAVRKYTAASGYTSSVEFPETTGEANSGLAVNGAQKRLYMATGSSQIRAYDTETGSLVETIPLSNPARGIAVDEGTDTLFVAVGSGSSGYIEERPGLIVPDLTTGEPTGFATLHGHVDPAGGGEVTSCQFEFSTSANYASPTSVPCSPAPNYASPQDVTADLTGKVTGEVQYHFRLKAGNANGTNISTDKTFTPHYVAGLHTDAATEVDRKSGELHGSYLGTGEETHLYFKWGLTPAYGNTTPVQDIPANAVPTSVSAPLTNVLEPQKVYHYEIVATNGKGTSEANDATFETKPAVFGISTDPATSIKTTTADLNGSFTGDGFDTKYFFEYGSSTLYGNKTASSELKTPSGPTTLPAVSISELQPLHTYHYRVVAENSFGVTKGPDKVFTTFTAPVIITQSTSGVTGTTADLHAVINPHGVEAEYHFEYGTSIAYGTTVPIPDGTIPTSEAPETVTEHLTGLNGGVYHFRIAARNIYGESVSKDQTFNFYPPVCPNATVRQQTGSNNLPDCRAYELVSPEDAGITQIFPANVPFSPEASSPSRLVYAGAFGSVAGTGETINNVGDTYVATRTASGWKSKYVGLPSSKGFLSGGPPWDYGGYPPGWVQGYTGDHWTMNEVVNSAMSELVSWDAGHVGPNDTFDQAEYEGFSDAPYVWSTTTGKQVDRWPTNVMAIPGGDQFKGRTYVSPDLSHFVFTSDIPFAPGGQPGDMYDNNTQEATIDIINFNENSERIAVSPVETSTDGTHILMTSVASQKQRGFFSLTSGLGELFMRVEGQTYDIAAKHNVQYIDMTPDGETVYFTSTEDLTSDNSDTDTSRDLYMWSQNSAEPNHLTLVSRANEPFAGNTDACSAFWTSKCGVVPISFVEGYSIVQGGIGGGPYSDNYVAPGNGDIYFLSPERLAGNNGIDGEENLYVFRGGKLKFIAALEPSGVACLNQAGNFECSATAVARMQTTPDDSYMAFITGSKVTAYENEGHAEMYRYTPDTEELICVSCMPSGKPPAEDATGSHNGRYLADDGRIFFETADPLVPQDTNEGRDVYEYAEGRPQLITSGTAASNDVFGIGTLMAKPGLVGVSADGTDLYFSTYDVLVGQDRNGEALKIYDARSGGGFQFTPPVPPCVAADECHGAGSSAPPGTPGGTGPDLGNTGNLKPQPEHRKKAKKKAKKKRHGKGRRKGGRND